MWLAWREFRESLAWVGAPPDAVEIDPPRWFIVCELGLGACQCERCYADRTSFTFTIETLARANRSALKQLGVLAPLRVTYPKDLDLRDPRDRKAAGRGGASRVRKKERR